MVSNTTCRTARFPGDERDPPVDGRRGALEEALALRRVLAKSKPRSFSPHSLARSITWQTPQRTPVTNYHRYNSLDKRLKRPKVVPTILRYCGWLRERPGPRTTDVLPTLYRLAHKRLRFGSWPPCVRGLLQYYARCCYNTRRKCGRSSIGRASAFQAECRGFEPLRPLLRHVMSQGDKGGFKGVVR